MANMTISQALRRIKKLKGQLGEHRTHAVASVTHLAEQTPAYGFSVSVEAADAVLAELLKLQTAVAVANAATFVEVDGRKILLAQATRELRELASTIAWIKTLPVKAQDKTVEAERDHDGEKWVTTTKTFTCHLPEAKRAEQASKLQDRFDALNDVVETTNHKTTISL